MISTRLYLGGAVVVALVVYALGWLFGADLIQWATNLRGQAGEAGQAAMGTLVTGPVLWVFRNGIVGAVIAGLVWPIALAWIFVILCLIVALAGLQVADEFEETGRQGVWVVARLFSRGV